MISSKGLMQWLKEIDKGLSRKIVLVAVGGTAMTLLGIKPSTLDVDFCLDPDDVGLFKSCIKDNKFKVDIFTSGYIFSQQLPEDYKEVSVKIRSGMVNIDLRALSLGDIIITKAARYNERDEDDIMALVNSRKVDKQKLVKRFNEVKETYAGKKEDYEYHFGLILKRHFS